MPKKVNPEDIFTFLDPLHPGQIYVSVGGGNAIEESGYALAFHLIKMAGGQSTVGNAGEAKKCLQDWSTFALHMQKMFDVARSKIEDYAFLKMVGETEVFDEKAMGEIFFNDRN